jgi:hypothetical protein
MSNAVHSGNGHCCYDDKEFKCQGTELEGIIVPALSVDGDVMLSHTVVDVCRLAVSRAVCARTAQWQWRKRKGTVKRLLLRLLSMITVTASLTPDGAGQ